MKQTTEHTHYLWQKYVAQKATLEEVEELYQLIRNASADDVNIGLFQAEMEKYPLKKGMDEDTRHNMLQHILQGNKAVEPLTTEDEPAVPVYHRIHFLRTAWFRYAAILLLVLGTGAYFFYNASNRTGNTIAVASAQPEDIKPAGNNATLTLADGTVILLDSAANGQLTSQGNTSIVKLNEGALAYNAGSGGSEGLYNTISTRKGGQYQIVLPDGSKVWLNAASSIRFPTVFVKERKVTVTGEAYFEIEHSAAMPFRVVTDRETEVEVLGTSFNIMAYSNEASINTTLLQGAVRVMKGTGTTTLKPGQQAQVTDKVTVLKNADVNKAIAWKNGMLNFEGVGLKEMMRQLERWYDIDVIYEGNVADQRFFGKMSRKVPLSTVVDALKGFGLHCKTEGRKLIVTP